MHMKIIVVSGACVLTNIDATKVHENALLMNKKFDKIIFNFPHIGGKMKIHLNRKLLKDFFISASHLMKKTGGCIIVSLCSGQGADFENKRTWADSWQVVDMAGHANLLLVECSRFQWEHHPTYSNVGYRSLEKGFHTENALVHKFCFVETSLHQQAENVLNYYNQSVSSNDNLRPLFIRKMKRDILNDSRSPTSFVIKQLVNLAHSKFNIKHHIEKEPLIHMLKESDIASALHLWGLSCCDLFLFSCYIVNEPTTDFKKIPVTTQTLLFGNENYSILSKFLAETVQIFGFSDSKIVEKTCSSNSSRTKKLFLQGIDNSNDILLADYFFVSYNGSYQPIAMIFVDNLVSKLFSIQNWRQLWADNVHVTYLQQRPAIGGICPYPVRYTFDISFAIPDSFAEEKMVELLWDLAGEVLVNMSKVSEFLSSSDNKRSLCFRLSYLSFDHPMCRETVLDYHQNVIGGALEKILGVFLK